MGRDNMRRDVLILNLERQLVELAGERCGKTVQECTPQELYSIVMELCRRILSVTERNVGEKKVYYISAEFLMGKLLINNIINLRLYDRMSELLKKYGRSLDELEEVEAEPALGNGGLGRLAACFLDSIATRGLPGEGLGLYYHYGLFRQTFRDKLQCAEKDEWIRPDGWAARSDVTFDVFFGERKVTSRMYNVDVIGYDNGVNELRLFDIESVDESLVRDGITFDKESIEKNLTLFLYPDDSDEAGRKLRIYQQYFLVCNAAQWILREMKARQYDLRHLYNHAVIQINDTHPTMIIPELIRILVDEKAMSYDEAIEVVSRTCAYTNHTILSEALEKWPLSYFEEIVPQLLPVIRELDRRVREKYSDPAVQIIDENGIVHMAHIDLHYGFSVNGVAAIHTQILKDTELHPFYEIYPDKFNNKTNGVTFRRWLLCCNHELSNELSRLIGDGYKKDAGRLEKLLEYKDNQEVLMSLDAIKQRYKRELTAWIRRKEGVRLEEDGIFDIQIKRIHEYKRQQMNALYIIHRMLEIRRGRKPQRPVNFIFGGKAAPAYVAAQDVIHLLLVLQQLVNTDPEISRYLRVVMVTNYDVTYAQKLVPACDVSEQISLASKEASGTGNMKLMLNGAVTLGTSDGANVEIHELVGDDNIYLFGQTSEEVIAHQKSGDYRPRDLYESSPVIREAVDFIVSEETLTLGHRENLERLHRELIEEDPFMTLADLEDYIRVKNQCLADYEDRTAWAGKMLVNIAKAGYFSSDRTIAEYNRDIWRL